MGRNGDVEVHTVYLGQSPKLDEPIGTNFELRYLTFKEGAFTNFSARVRVQQSWQLNSSLADEEYVITEVTERSFLDPACNHSVLYGLYRRNHDDVFGSDQDNADVVSTLCSSKVL